MHQPGYTAGKIPLLEGEEHPFEISNCIQLQDNELYYVLCDVNHLKHFMPAKPYENYNLKIGTVITCRIDKINCTGRIHLEPRHPVYERAKEYLFKLKNDTHSCDDSFILVKDLYGNEIKIAYPDPQNLIREKHSHIKCKVIAVKKGIPELEFSGIN